MLDAEVLSLEMKQGFVMELSKATYLKTNQTRTFPLLCPNIVWIFLSFSVGG